MSEKIYVIDKEELVPLIGKEVVHGEETIALFLLSNGEVKAIGNKCPHKDGPLVDGLVSGEYVYCPLHDYKVSLEDGQVQAPDTGCVKTYETVVENEKVYVML